MPCTDKNALLREGTSLLTRTLAALDTAYAKADERLAADIILFAKRYAAYLNYFDDHNTLNGDWQVLMKTDVSVSLATLAAINVREITYYKKRVYKSIIQATSDAAAKKEFKYLFDILFSLVTRIDEQYQLLPANVEYKNIFSDVIKNKLQLPLANIEKCFMDFKSQNLLDYTVLQLDNDAPAEVISNASFARNNLLSIEWKALAPAINITLPVLSAREIIVYITRHNLFNAQIELLLNGVSTLVTRADNLLVQTLDNYPDHAPHYALFIAFIKLFRHAQDSLNTYTQRHLDFYYKDTLQLVNKAPVADAAHLVFELQKNIEEERLLANTFFKGSKDITGKEINYALTEDIVLNKASVAQVQAMQLVEEDIVTLKASPVANSADGLGAKLTNADKSWFSFGDPRQMPTAKPGFAIASNLLFLNEGTRIIIITINFTKAVADFNTLSFYDMHCFTAQFTGKKKWEPVPGKVSMTNPSPTQLVFAIQLTPDDQAIVPYSEKVHAENMGIELPVLKIQLNQEISKSVPYTLFCKEEMASVVITVEALGLKDLALSNDKGAIDASKPFKPFGDFPDSGAGFYIGSKEIFQKQLLALVLFTGWKAAPVISSVIDSNALYLRQQVFGKESYTASLSNTAITLQFAGANKPFKPTIIDFGKNEALTTNTREGFLQLKLKNADYSLTAFMDAISANLSGTTITLNSSASPPNYTIAIPAAPVPKELVLDTFSIGYVASATIGFDAAPTGNHLFYHLGAFGFTQVSRSLVDVSAATENTRKITLMQDINHSGELFVGLQQAAAGMVVNVLFQVADGSSNPLHNMEKLEWYYLATNNNWKYFKKEDITDRTNNFTQSGIVTLTLPADCSSENTEHQQGLHWIKVTANPFADAVCKMILVQAQAARVQLVQDDASAIEFRQLLPANSISKLLVSNSAIKTIQQPFDSFNGRMRETNNQFYVRVSERLRHKQRAITIWDYEHIVMEQFPKVFKVKCINQAGFYPKQGQEVFCENFPGHVTVVTIPNLSNNTSYNPLLPYTPIGLLTNITDYLTTITSPFVKLHVKNPQFEEIQLDFKVQFYPQYQEDFYLKLLNTEIERFLCPWAFNNQEEISFGGKMYKSTLINFVEERPYVDFVTCFKMHQFINRGQAGAQTLTDIEEATASTARSILVSYFDEVSSTKHHIVSNATCIC